eukprot:1160679-Pelagomonas_calceolata.AAC.7
MEDFASYMGAGCCKLPMEHDQGPSPSERSEKLQTWQPEPKLLRDADEVREISTGQRAHNNLHRQGLTCLQASRSQRTTPSREKGLHYSRKKHKEVLVSLYNGRGGLEEERRSRTRTKLMEDGHCPIMLEHGTIFGWHQEEDCSPGKTGTKKGAPSWKKPSKTIPKKEAAAGLQLAIASYTYLGGIAESSPGLHHHTGPRDCLLRPSLVRAHLGSTRSIGGHISVCPGSCSFATLLFMKRRLIVAFNGACMGACNTKRLTESLCSPVFPVEAHQQVPADITARALSETSWKLSWCMIKVVDGAMTHLFLNLTIGCSMYDGIGY